MDLSLRYPGLQENCWKILGTSQHFFSEWSSFVTREVWNYSYSSNLTSLEKSCSKNQQQIRSLHLLSTTERYVAKGASLSCGFKFLRNCSYHPTAHNLQFSTLTPLSFVIEFLVKCKDWDPTGLIDSDFWSDPTAACRAFFWKQSLCDFNTTHLPWLHFAGIYSSRCTAKPLNKIIPTKFHSNSTWDTSNWIFLKKVDIMLHSSPTVAISSREIQKEIIHGNLLHAQAEQ